MSADTPQATNPQARRPCPPQPQPCALLAAVTQNRKETWAAADAPLPSLQAFQEPVHNPPTGAKRADAGALEPCKPSPGHKSCLWFACCAAPPFRTSWSAHEQAPCAAEGSWAGPPHWPKSLAPAWPAAETDQMRCAAQLRSRRPNFVSKSTLSPGCTRVMQASQKEGWQLCLDRSSHQNDTPPAHERGAGLH